MKVSAKRCNIRPVTAIPTPLLFFRLLRSPKNARGNPTRISGIEMYPMTGIQANIIAMMPSIIPAMLMHYASGWLESGELPELAPCASLAVERPPLHIPTVKMILGIKWTCQAFLTCKEPTRSQPDDLPYAETLPRYGNAVSKGLSRPLCAGPFRWLKARPSRHPRLCRECGSPRPAPCPQRPLSLKRRRACPGSTAA